MHRFTESEQIVLKSLSAAINPEKQIELDNELLNQADWDTVGLISSHHAVSPMVFDFISNYREKIPNDIFRKWYNHILKALSSNAAVAETQEQLVYMLNGYFDYVILKGLAAAAYYPKPELRCLGDVDFLVRHENLAECEKIIINNGYKKHIETACHITYEKNGRMLEMHFEIPGIPHGESGKRVRKFVEPIFENIKTEGKFNAPCDMLHGVVLLLHSAHHLVSEGLGLRHLCDWACFVKSTANESFWNELLTFLSDIGLLKFTKILTKLCANYLNIDCPEWAKETDDAVCFELMQDVLSGGNFGVLDRSRSGSGMMISEHAKGGTRNSKIYNLLRTLHSTMYSACPVLKKAPILYPFLFVFRIVKYLVLMLKGKRPSLIAASQKADERKKVYNKLEIFEKNKKDTF